MAPELRKVRLKIGAGEFETEVSPDELPALLRQFALATTTLDIPGGKFTTAVTATELAPTPRKARDQKPFERENYSPPPQRGQNAKLVLDAVRALGAGGATYTQLRHQVFQKAGVRVPGSSMSHALNQLVRKGLIERDGDLYRIKATLHTVREGSK
jgi:hypothetical protein